MLLPANKTDTLRLLGQIYSSSENVEVFGSQAHSQISKLTPPRNKKNLFLFYHLKMYIYFSKWNQKEKKKHEHSKLLFMKNKEKLWIDRRLWSFSFYIRHATCLSKITSNFRFPFIGVFFEKIKLFLFYRLFRQYMLAFFNALSGTVSALFVLSAFVILSNHILSNSFLFLLMHYINNEVSH